MIIENFKDDKEALRAMTGELVRYMDRKDVGLPFNPRFVGRRDGTEDDRSLGG